jgi:hypothetical protein
MPPFKFIITLFFLLVSIFFGYSSHAKSLEQRVENLELERFLNTIDFNGTLKNRYDYLNTERTTSGVKDEYSIHPLSLYFGLDMKASIGTKVDFFGRVSASKYYTQLQNEDNRTDFIHSLSSGRSEKGHTIHLERAFFNYKLLSSLTLSMGRLPTIDGPPYHIYDGLARLGTYPTMAYNSQLDGVALTHKLPYLGKNHSLTIRGIYTPFYSTEHSLDGATSVRVKRSTKSRALGSPRTQNETVVYSAMAEYKIKRTNFWDHFLFIFQNSHVDGLQVDDAVSKGTALYSVFASPTLGGNGDPQAAKTRLESLVSQALIARGVAAATANAQASSLASTTFNGSTLELDYDIKVFYVELSNLFHQGIQLALTYALSKVDSKGYLESNSTLASYADTLTDLKELGVKQGALTDKESASNKGNSFLITLAYQLPIESENRPLLGLEYLKGEKHYTSFNLNSDDLSSFYDTRGKAMHFWATLPFSNNAFHWRTGYMHQDHKYNKGVLSTLTRETNFKEKTIYTQLRLDF